MSLTVCDFSSSDRHQYFTGTYVPYLYAGNIRWGIICDFEGDDCDDVRIEEVSTGDMHTIPTSDIRWNGLTGRKLVKHGRHLVAMAPNGDRSYKKPASHATIGGLMFANNGNISIARSLSAVFSEYLKDSIDLPRSDWPAVIGSDPIILARETGIMRILGEDTDRYQVVHEAIAYTFDTVSEALAKAEEVLC